MALSVETLAVSKKYSNLLALGIKDIKINGATITFILQNDTTAIMTFPTPKDGVSIKGVSINNQKHLIVSLNNNTEIDAGLIPSIKGDKGEKGDKGDPGKDGIDGRNGVDGRDGMDGKDGVFADLTQEERESLKGDKGDKGDPGEKGDKGDSILVVGEEIIPTNGIVSLMMEPNKTYIVNEPISMLNLSAPHTYNPYDEFYIMFTTSADGCTVVKPDNWTYLTGSTTSFESNTFYEFDVVNNKIICPNGTAVV